jgi:5-methylcytosine-specific restriction protein A
MPTAEKFRAALDAWISEATRVGKSSVDVNSGKLHRIVGGYPAQDHRMPVCCAVMESAMRAGDKILTAPPKGRGASLTIRYKLPR